MDKKVLLEVPEGLWAAMKGQAQVEGRFVREVVAAAFRRYLDAPGEPSRPVVSDLPETAPSGHGKTLTDLARLGLLTTGGQMLGGRDGRLCGDGGEQGADAGARRAGGEASGHATGGDAERIRSRPRESAGSDHAEFGSGDPVHAGEAVSGVSGARGVGRDASVVRERLREYPEDESQDPDDPVGF
jgi:hypothetical protein